MEWIWSFYSNYYGKLTGSLAGPLIWLLVLSGLQPCLTAAPLVLLLSVSQMWSSLCHRAFVAASAWKALFPSPAPTEPYSQVRPIRPSDPLSQEAFFLNLEVRVFCYRLSQGGLPQITHFRVQLWICLYSTVSLPPLDNWLHKSKHFTHC